MLVTLAKLIHLKFTYGSHFSNDDIISADLRSRAYNPIPIQLVIASMLSPRAPKRVWIAKLFAKPMILRLLIRAIEDRSEETPIDGTLIQHNRIFLIIARVAGNGND